MNQSLIRQSCNKFNSKSITYNATTGKASLTINQHQRTSNRAQTLKNLFTAQKKAQDEIMKNEKQEIEKQKKFSFHC